MKRGVTKRPKHLAFRSVGAESRADCACHAPLRVICPRHESAAYAAYGAQHKAGHWAPDPRTLR